MVKYDSEKLKLKDIIKAIEKGGYTTITNDNNNFVIISFIIAFGIYLILRQTNLFNFVPEIDDNIGYGLLFIVELFTLIHYIAMCGGINIAVSMINSDNKFKPGLLYNLSRLTSYTIIGGIVGAHR